MSRAPSKRGVIISIIVANLTSVFLFGLRIIATHDTTYWFMFWNLILAWMPVLFAWMLVKRLKVERWQKPIPVLLSLLWLGFLPNSFYIISDLVHLQSTGEIGLLYDSVLFVSLILNGMLAGFISLYWVHKALLERQRARLAHGLIIASLFITSFAIYFGRSLRWNTWDVLVNPAGLLFDVSERVINPFEHPQVFVTTLTFFLLLGTSYLVIWEGLEFIRKSRH